MAKNQDAQSPPGSNPWNTLLEGARDWQGQNILHLAVLADSFKIAQYFGRCRSPERAEGEGTASIIEQLLEEKDLYGKKPTWHGREASTNAFDELLKVRYEYDVFVSYRVKAEGDEKDGSGLASDLANRLKQDYALEVYLDKKEIKDGDNWINNFSKGVVRESAPAPMKYLYESYLH